MKKITLAVVLILVLALSFTSCSLFGSKCSEHAYDDCTDTNCNNCNEERTALEHAYDNCEDTDCNTCGATRSALTHKFDDCTDTECNNCDATREGSAHVFDNCDDTMCNVCSKIRPASHNVSEIARVDSTCTVAGNDKYYQCKDCNKLFADLLATEPLDAIPTLELAAHALVPHDALDPTCEEAGYKAYNTCENCDYTTFEEVRATGHSLKTIDAQAPTCTADGWNEYKICTNEGCDYKVDYVELPANGHTEVIDEAVAPTCTATGLTEGKHCSACDEVLVPQNPLQANGHTDNDGDYRCDVESCKMSICQPEEHVAVSIPEVPAACTTTGLSEGSKCSLCGDILVKQEEIPALGHTEVIDEAVAPTCTATGLTEGKHCSVCNTVLVAQTTVDALGHTEADAVQENVVDPDCENTGSYDAVVYCSVCNTELSRTTVTVDALGHTEVVDEAVAPTCTATGLTEGKHCSDCGKVLVEQIDVDATGHTYSHSCDATCDTCGYTRPEEELEHNYSNEYDPTCNNEGCDEEREAESPEHGGTTLPEHTFD